MAFGSDRLEEDLAVVLLSFPDTSRYVYAITEKDSESVHFNDVPMSTNDDCGQRSRDSRPPNG